METTDIANAANPSIYLSNCTLGPETWFKR